MATRLTSRLALTTALSAITTLASEPLAAKQHSKVKQALALLTEVRTATVRKLVILDLNKVLVWREYQAKQHDSRDRVTALTTKVAALSVGAGREPPVREPPASVGQVPSVDPTRFDHFS